MRFEMKNHKSFQVCVLLACFLALAARPGVSFAEKRHCPYLLVVSWYSVTSLDQITKEWLEKANATPFDGIGAMLSLGRRAARAPDDDKYLDRIRELRRYAQKDIWPWIFLNRMFGGPSLAGRKVYSLMTDSERTHFTAIKGMDLYDEQGALSAFKGLFRQALKVARTFGSPGIIIDHEAYNNPGARWIPSLRRLQGKTGPEIVRRLEQIGQELAVIVNDEYPEATLWFSAIEPDSACGYIVRGMLEAAVHSGMKFKVVEGGEKTVRYVHKTLPELEGAIANQKETLRRWLPQYPDRLIPAGTTTLIDNSEQLGPWFKAQYEGSRIKSVEDMAPFLRVLFSNYRYIWIYAAREAHFDPFDPVTGKKFFQVIDRVRSDTKCPQ